MQQLINSGWILLVGVLGVMLMVFIKIQDITNSNPNLSFKTSWNLFFSKAMASYLASITALLVYAITHDQWGKAFVDGDGKTNLVHRILGLQMIMGFFIGAGMQYGIYKFFLKKVDGIMKIWSGDAKTGAPDVDTPVINKEVEIAKSAIEKGQQSN